MEQINWSNFTPDLFQRFCNVLFSFEISKRFVPFSAAGRDGGIDGLFVGEYNGQSGKWRFQDKFHQGSGTIPVGRLKADMRDEVKKLKNEEFFILVTNVEITSPQRDELISIGNANLPTHAKNTQIQIWDGAKLFTLYIKFPILRLWLEEGFATAQLVKYDLYFAQQLANGIEKADTLGNHFISRPDASSQLTGLMHDPEITIALITGEAGIGKTRLAVEFFKQEIDPIENWEALVLQNHNIAFDRITFALSGEKNYLILVDDVDTYSAAEIMDLSKLAKVNDKIIKFIFTASSILWHDSFRLLSTRIQNQMVTISLGKLTQEQTSTFFQRELFNSNYIHFLPTLVDISNGRPILIVALLRAISQKIAIPKIKEEGFLKEYVLTYFELVIRKIKTDSFIPLYKIRASVQLICLVEPFDYQSKELQSILAEIALVTIDEMAFILKILVQEGLAVGRYVTNIKPDYYSDIMLSAVDEQWIENTVERVPTFLPNIIRNLASVDEINEKMEGVSSRLDSILIAYLKKLDGSNNPAEISTIAKTIYSVAYLKPEIAIQFMDKLHFQLRLKGSPIQREFASYQDYHVNYPFGLMSTIRNILYTLLYFERYYEYVFSSCLIIYGEITDKQLFRNTWGYSLRDLLNGYQCQPQSYFVNKVDSILEISDNPYGEFFIESLSDLLKLEFRGTTLDGEGRTMVITTYFVPSNPEVKALRKAIIGTLIRLHRDAEDETLRQKALYQILDVPRNILAVQRNPTPYNGEDEIEAVLRYLRDRGNSFSSEEMKLVLTHIHRIKRWDKLSTFTQWLDDIEAHLRPTNLAEMLNNVILRADLSNEHDQSKVYAGEKTEFQQLIQQYSGRELAQAVSAIFSETAQPEHYFWPFLEVLPDTSVTKAMEFYTTLFQIRRSLIYLFGSVILRPLLLRFKEEAFYWSSVTAMEEDDTEEARNVIFHVYAFGFAPENVIGPSHLELLQRIFQNRTPNNHILAGTALLTILDTDRQLFEKMAEQFLQNCVPKAADRFFRGLFQERSGDFTMAMKLFLTHTVRLSISYELEQCIVQIIKAGFFIEVFTYFTNRYRYLMDRIAKQEGMHGYELVPLTVDRRFQRSFDEDSKIIMYREIVTWFVNEHFEAANLYFGKQLVEYFIPSKMLSEPLDAFFREFLDGDQFKNKTLAERLTECIGQFEEKNERLIELVISYWQTGLLYFSNDGEMLADHLRACSFAIWHVGSKMGTPGMPFKEDLRLRELLTEAVSKNRTNAQILKLLNGALAIVDKAISRDSEWRDETW